MLGNGAEEGERRAPCSVSGFARPVFSTKTPPCYDCCPWVRDGLSSPVSKPPGFCPGLTLWRFLEVSEKQFKHCVNLYYHFSAFAVWHQVSFWEESCSVPHDRFLGYFLCAQGRPLKASSLTCCKSGFLFSDMYLEHPLSYLVIFHQVILYLLFYGYTTC